VRLRAAAVVVRLGGVLELRGAVGRFVVVVDGIAAMRVEGGRRRDVPAAHHLEAGLVKVDAARVVWPLDHDAVD